MGKPLWDKSRLTPGIPLSRFFVPRDVVRLLSRTTVTHTGHTINGTPSACWLFRGCKDDGGYGLFWYKGASRKAHRVSYVIFTGQLTEGFDVHHNCSQPACVNPSHLCQKDSYDNRQEPNHARASASDDCPI